MAFNPVEFAPQARLDIEHFSWNFLRASPNAWAMAHVLNPFLLQMIFQDWKITTIFFFLWESLEVLILTVFGAYGIFVGDQSDFEPIADSLIGDPFNGILGIMLAFMFVIAFRVPHWAPSVYGRARTVWWRRILLYLLMVVSFLPYNAQIVLVGSSRPIYIGVFIALALHTLWLSLSLYYYNRTPVEMALFWGGWKGDTHRTQIYVGWLAVMALLQFGSTYYITYVYYQVWFLWGVAMLSLFLFTAAQGRLRDVFYYWSLEYRKAHYFRKPMTQYDDNMFPTEKQQ